MLECIRSILWAKKKWVKEKKPTRHNNGSAKVVAFLICIDKDCVLDILRSEYPEPLPHIVFIIKSIFLRKSPFLMV